MSIRPTHRVLHADTDFVALGATNNAWNVVRSEFDHLLLKHAASAGVHVYEQTRVTDIIFDTSASSPQPLPSSPVSPPSCFRGGRQRSSSVVGFAPSTATGLPPSRRPRSVIYETAFGGKQEITFDYLVDASGRAGLMSTKYVSRCFTPLAFAYRWQVPQESQIQHVPQKRRRVGLLEKHRHVNTAKTIMRRNPQCLLVPLVQGYQQEKRIMSLPSEKVLRKMHIPTTMAWSLSYGSNVTCSIGLNLFSRRYCLADALGIPIGGMSGSVCCSSLVIDWERLYSSRH